MNKIVGSILSATPQARQLRQAAEAAAAGESAALKQLRHAEEARSEAVAKAEEAQRASSIAVTKAEMAESAKSAALTRLGELEQERSTLIARAEEAERGLAAARALAEQAEHAQMLALARLEKAEQERSVLLGRAEEAERALSAAHARAEEAEQAKSAALAKTAEAEKAKFAAIGKLQESEQERSTIALRAQEADLRVQEAERALANILARVEQAEQGRAPALPRAEKSEQPETSEKKGGEAEVVMEGLRSLEDRLVQMIRSVVQNRDEIPNTTAQKIDLAIAARHTEVMSAAGETRDWARQLGPATGRLLEILERLADSSEELKRLVNAHAIHTDDGFHDLKRLMSGATINPVHLLFKADRTVAMDSPDHLEPRGTRNDNTRHPRFVRRAEQLFRPIRHLDLGCAGGGLVWDFTLAGHLSVGVEGSDYSLKEQRAEWRNIPDRLFTADICYPFEICDRSGERVLFNLVTAWELFEHIPTDLVDSVIANIRANMTRDAVLACSIATFVDQDPVTGTVYHQTVKPKEWWLERFATYSLFPESDLFAPRDFVRGSGNPRSHDWDAQINPEMGFHLALRRMEN